MGVPGHVRSAREGRNVVRGMGRIFTNKGSRNLYIAYFHRGVEHRESCGSPHEADARRLLKERLGAIQSRRFVPQEQRVTFEHLVKGYEQDYDLRGLRTRSTAGLRISHLQTFFARERALEIGTDRIRAYQAFRRGEGASAATVNRETTALGRMFRIAMELGQLSRMPVFPRRLEERAPRQGFFEHAEYRAIRSHLPAPNQDVLDFAYFSGWRRGEILGLTWREVDLEGGVIRLDPDRSKTKLSRVLPLAPPLREVLERRLALRRLETPRVFHWDGEPIGDWRKRWHRACRLAGLPGKHLHDCRRTAARNLIRAGVPERVAMMLTGHKTRSVFDRYNIVSEQDLMDAGDRLASYVERQSTRPIVVPLAAVQTRAVR
jgi:integrase